MYVLGLGGGLDRLHELKYEFPEDMAHDAAAVLLKDGRVVAAIEEERLNRIKHTNKLPLRAIRFCLETAGIAMNEIDKISIYGNEGNYNALLKQKYLQQSGRTEPFSDMRATVRRIIAEEFGHTPDAGSIEFVPHHAAHAMSAYAMSGFDESLILTIDGQGDGISGMVFTGKGRKMEEHHKFYEKDSLGFFYLEVIRYLGYSMFDEYKVMGLAPYGDPSKYGKYFKRLYTLLPEGKYSIHFNHISLLYDLFPPRRKGEPFSQVHQDIAAALQQSLEEIVFHIVTHYREHTKLNKLCLAGGVAHNCSMNGKLLYSGQFDDIFVQPAAHDAGSVLGAALYTYHKAQPEAQPVKLDHLYWGTDVANQGDVEIERLLNDWSSYIEFTKEPDIYNTAASLLADGKVIGWVQGRSEFGPRALGNRSILADPRPADNKQIINAMVKKREGYRPFAPSVLEEHADAYFELPDGVKRFPFMIFVLNVRPERRELLGAITHVDGTARVHTVSKATNAPYWSLIQAFHERTGVPMLLNTSFNNNAEPIVDSAYDAIVCFLTTGLHYLVIGDYLIAKKDAGPAQLAGLIPELPEHVVLTQANQYTAPGEKNTLYSIGVNYSDKYNGEIAPEMFGLLQASDGVQTVGRLMGELAVPAGRQTGLLAEMNELWSRRLVRLYPRKRKR